MSVEPLGLYDNFCVIFLIVFISLIIIIGFLLWNWGYSFKLFKSLLIRNNLWSFMFLDASVLVSFGKCYWVSLCLCLIYVKMISCVRFIYLKSLGVNWWSYLIWCISVWTVSAVKKKKILVYYHCRCLVMFKVFIVGTFVLSL